MGHFFGPCMRWLFNPMVGSRGSDLAEIVQNSVCKRPADDSTSTGDILGTIDEPYRLPKEQFMVRQFILLSGLNDCAASICRLLRDIQKSKIDRDRNDFRYLFAYDRFLFLFV